MAVGLGGPELRDTTLGDEGLGVDGLADLGVLELDKLVCDVAVGVVGTEDLEGFLVATLGDQPTGRLRDQEDARKHDRRGGGLEDGGNAPRPGVLNAESTVGGPGSDDRPDVPGGVVERGDTGTVLEMSKLSDEKRSGTVGEGDTESDEETGSREHAEILRSGLEGDTDKHDNDTNNDGNATSAPIGEPGRDGNGADGTDRENGVQETTLSRGGVEICKDS